MKRRITALPIIFYAGAACALTPDQWQYRQSVVAPASGLVEIQLPAETLNFARPDLSDLRIIDAAEKEVPFLIDQPMPQPESTVRARDFRAELAPAETRLLITTGTDSTVAGVVLEASGGSTFIKAARVEGSSDQKDWRVLASGAPLFRMATGATHSAVTFPEGKWPFLRIVVDDNRTPPTPWTGAKLIIAGSPAPTEAIGATIKSRDENPGITRLGLDLGAANLRLASIRLGTSEPVFTRRVTVVAPELSEENLCEQTLSSAVLYRLDLNGKTESHLDIPVDKQISGREVVLLIDNGDSPPLGISDVHVERRLTRLLFFAPSAGPYTLLSGNTQCDFPRYDLSQLGDQLRQAGAAEAQLSTPTLNPGYNAADSLPRDLAGGAKIDLALWRFRKPIGMTKAGTQQIELDPDILARAAPDFRDLRVVSGERQLPYLIERTSIERTLALDAAIANDPKRPTFSRWQLKLPQAALPLTRITCVSNSALFERTFRFLEQLSDERGDQYPSELGQTTWRRLPNQPPGRLAASFTGRPRTDTIWMEADNGDNPPIELHDFRGCYPVTRIIFASPTSQAVTLYYGNDEAVAPRYDAKLIAPQLLRAERTSAVLGSQEISKSERATKGLTGAGRYIFWAVLGIVVIALLILISRLLPKTT